MIDQPHWWTDRDEMILRGAMDELDRLRPAQVERVIDRLEYVPIAVRRRRWSARQWGAVIVLFALVALVLVTAAVPDRAAPSPCPGDAAGCADMPSPAGTP